MKYAWIIACREFTENARTKGFWIGLFLFPAILFLSIQVPVFLQKKAMPTRHFLMVDQSESLAPVISAHLDNLHQKRVLQELIEHARSGLMDPGRSELLRTFSNTDPRALELFRTQGGKTAFLEKLKPGLKPGTPEFVEPKSIFQMMSLPSDVPSQGDLAVISEKLRPYLKGDKKLNHQGQKRDLHAAILVPKNYSGAVLRPGAAMDPGQPQSGIEYWSKNLADTKLREEMEKAVNAEIRRTEYLARGMDSAQVLKIEQTRLLVTSLNPSKQQGDEKVNSGDVMKQWAPTAMVYVLWIAVFSIIQMLLNNTVEEKSNRIVEVLLSSVTPNELMLGKLLGIGAVGLTMIGSWIVALFAILSWVPGAGQIGPRILDIARTSPLLPAFVIYFFLGYFMYAALILALGSLCNTIKDAQNYMGVILMILMVPIFTMTFIPRDPNGAVASFLSWIPLWTPFIMLNRINADPPLFDLVGTMILLLLSVAGFLWLSARVFRHGVLRTGQPPRIMELFRLLTKSSKG